MTAAPEPGVHVVIPAHDEAELIGRCLTSVAAAAERLLAHDGTRTSVLVVADRCTDATADLVAAFARATAGRPDTSVLAVDAGCVGRARDLGVRRVLEREPRPTWVAMTDADSTVAPDWLTTQVRAARRGCDLWVGAVRPDPDSLSRRLLHAWEARHHSPDELHVHGANLGFTAATYARAGGFPPLAEHEDLAFVRAAIAAGARWSIGPADVHTSGRTTGRTAGGFAGYIRALAADPGLPRLVPAEEAG